MTLNLFSFNPMRTVRRPWWSMLLRRREPLGNFGDLVGPIVVKTLLSREGVVFDQENSDKSKRKLLSVGSVLHFANDFDVLWGCGRNGKVPDNRHNFEQLDVRAVRGPLTRDFLLKKGISVPEIYGDPAILLPILFPEIIEIIPKIHDILIIPNYNDTELFHSNFPVISPLNDVWPVINSIRQARFVVSSSLHGIIIAEALGIPCRVLRSLRESPFKYEDYFYGTGRTDITYATTIEEAISLGPQQAPVFCVDPLIKSFPLEYFK